MKRSEYDAKLRGRTWLVIGYISSLLGGLVGMFIGSFLVNAKRTLPGGEVEYAFNDRTRKHGKIIMYLGCIVLIAAILFFLNWFFLEKILFGKPRGAQLTIFKC